MLMMFGFSLVTVTSTTLVLKAARGARCNACRRSVQPDQQKPAGVLVVRVRMQNPAGSG